MKNLLFFLLALFLLPMSVISQESEESNNKKGKPYDRWSLEAGVGTALPGNNYTDGFWVLNPNEEYEFPAFGSHFELGLRYMINEKFGVKLGGAINTFEDGDRSRQFESNMFRIGLEGVVNLRNLLNFDSWTKRFGLLGHAGVHQSWRNIDSRDNVDVSGGEADHDGGFMLGFTPQYRISNTFVIYADATFITNYRTHTTYDGARLPGVQNTRQGTISLGLQAYLGKKDVHADYYVEPDKENEELNRLANELDKLDKEIEDMKNNPLFVDNDNDGIPDVVNNYINNNYVSNDDPRLDNPGGSNPAITNLLNGRGFDIFFDFDMINPEDASIPDINALINYMNDNSDAKVQLVGYTDVLGSESYNDNLSYNRAKFINDILVATGINQSRIEYNGDGVNPDYPGENEYVRNLARRVSVKLK